MNVNRCPTTLIHLCIHWSPGPLHLQRYNCMYKHLPIHFTMIKYVKYFFLVTFVFTALYFIAQSYLTGKVNVYERKSSGQVATTSSTLKSKGSSISSPMKKKYKDKILRLSKNVSKKKATPKTQKKKITSFPGAKSKQKKNVTSIPLKIKITSRMMNTTSIPVKMTPQMNIMTSLPMANSPGMKKMALLPVSKSFQVKKMAPFPATNFPQMKIPLSLEFNGSFLDNRTFLAVLATTWLPEKEKVNVHENVARIWGSWPGIVQPVVYTDLSVTDKSFSQCMKFRWKFSPILKTNCAGIPVLKNMVTSLFENFPNSDFYGFVNSDILFDSGLIETFKFVKNHIKNRPVMLIGQRTNVDFTKPTEIHSPEDVPLLAKKGKIMKAYAIDYFLTDRSFPWNKFPDLVIGRHQYDNYLVYFGLMQKAFVIDVTQTVTAVHQTTKDGNNSGNHRHHKNCNRQMIKGLKKPFWSSWGFVTCARKYTHRNKSGAIVISNRKPWRHCHP